MKKFAVLAMSAFAILLNVESSEGQVFRRFRENVRNAIAPQPQVRPYSVPQLGQPQVIQPQPQVRIQSPAAPASDQPQQLTPYSKLTPQQRAAVPSGTGPRLNAPVPVNNPNAVNKSAPSRIRIVTYFDPRSGRTFQRRYLVPGDAVAPAVGGNAQPSTKKIGTGLPPARTPSVARAPSAVRTNRSTVPPIQFSPAQSPTATVASGAMPELAGPNLSGPTVNSAPIVTAAPAGASSTEQPIAASIESGETSRVETASAEIPDLSGIMIEPPASTPAGTAEEEMQNSFFGSDVDDDVEPSYSVLEASEEE